MKQNHEDEMRATRNFSRREMLLLAGTTAASLVVEYVRGRPVFAAPTSTETPLRTAAATPSCVVRPEQTEGPYFVDEDLRRSDIRSGKEGVPLRLVFRVSRMDGSACMPLTGATVHVWHCDALGVYSDVKDYGLFDTRGKTFLRGYQVTDPSGKVEFMTIYPGWYPGRTVHIHFKILTDSAAQRRHEFTSQLYFDGDITDQVYTQLPYAKKRERPVRNEEDEIFQHGGKKLMLPLTKTATGYAGMFDIALQLS